MDEKNAADRPFFKALLVPHRSLGRTGFIVLMTTVLIIWLTVGTYFLSIGAWPVFGFFGLDVVALYVAFHINYRAARAREEVSLSRLSLDIRKVPPSGRVEEHSFNPFWARFSIERRAAVGITGMAVEARDKRVLLGSFLNSEERESFARAFTKALAVAKGR